MNAPGITVIVDRAEASVCLGNFTLTERLRLIWYTLLGRTVTFLRPQSVLTGPGRVVP